MAQEKREKIWKALEERGYTRNGGTPPPQIKRPEPKRTPRKPQTNTQN